MQNTRLIAVLVLLPIAQLAAQEGATIAGRVTAPGGQPLGQATVFLEGMGRGTQTRDDGSYTLVVPAARVGQQARLGARAIGYTGKFVSITIQGNVTQNFELEVNPLRLGEVVVTGAGTESQTERLGASISSVKSEEILKSNEANVVQSLAAKAAGVMVTSSSGEPGSASFIQIRGQKSIQGSSQPLFVVDGVPVDNTAIVTTFSTAGTSAPNRMIDLNPADIESVEILKGAAAGAIYGARAGAGVVLITTKRGKANTVRWDARTTYSTDEVNRPYPLQRKFGQGSAGVAAVCRSVDCRLTGASFGPRLAAGTKVYDHFAEMFERGQIIDNSLSVSGGTDRSTFYASAGYMDNRGIIIADKDTYRRTTGLVKGNIEVNPRLRIGASANYASSSGSFIQRGSNLSGLLLAALRTPPEFNNAVYIDTATGLHRSYRFPRPSVTSGSLTRAYDNPFFLVKEAQNISDVGRAFGNINLDYAPTSWLNIKYTLGSDYSSDARIEGLPPSNSTEPTGIIDRANFTIFQVDHNLVATAQKQVRPWASASLTAGQNLNSQSVKILQARGRGYIAPNLFQLSNTISSNLLPLDGETLARLESYFGEAKLDLWNQLFLTGGVRSDASSTFGKSVRRNLFPKAQVAWEFTRTLGKTDAKGLLSYGKARVAYGQTGREPLAYQVFSGYNVAIVGDGWTNGINSSQNGNAGLLLSPTKGQDALKPERNAETEFGVDLAFFDSRIDLSTTYYNARSTDVILQLPVPPSTGFFAQIQNAATLENKGLEFAVNARAVDLPRFTWSVGALWSRNRNLVSDLRGADQIFLANGFVSGAQVGHPYGVFLGQDFARCRYGEQSNVVGGVDVNAACKAAGAKEGAMYVDGSGFPLMDETTRPVGNPQPDWTGSLTTNMTLFKKLQLSALLDIRRGGQMWNGTKGALYNFGAHKDTEIRGEKRTFGTDYLKGPVVGPGAGKSVTIDQVWFQNLGSGFVGPISQFVEDAGFARLREISAAYTLTGDFVRRSGFSAVDLRLSGRNLWLNTNYTGIDPESNLGGAVAARGNEYFNNPQSRSIVLTVGLKR